MDNEQLVKQCQAGDRKALGLMYESYLPPMRNVVEYYVHDSAAVWDILHDGFIIAFSSVGSLRQPERLEAWLTSIMKNLALRYLKKRSLSSPLSLDVDVEVDDDKAQEAEFTWEELERIVSRLPEGYGKVFRLAVLDGLSHKEISAMLGIAPHSSSSQLFHAKAMLRRMIRQYRAEVGVISLVTALLALWYLLPQPEETHQQTPPVLSSNDGRCRPMPATRDSAGGEKSDNSGMASAPAPQPFSSTAAAPLLRPDASQPATQRNIAEAPAAADSVPAIAADSVPQNNPGQGITRPFYPESDFAQTEISALRSREEDSDDWSIALAYSGTAGQNLSKTTFGSGSNDPNYPGQDEYKEETDHKMPLIIGLSVSKSLSDRWSLETGVRYSYMETDGHFRSDIAEKKTNQRIHYIGVPLKVSYRIFSAGGFSFYGQGGGALDIPLRGRTSSWSLINGVDCPIISSEKIHAPLQWSVGIGLGVQYRFSPNMSIFAEPSLNYYFNPGGRIKTIRQDRRFEVCIPLGMRFSW